MTPKDIRRVGLIGLGKMGLPMARHLVRRGFTVAGFDVDEGAMEKAAEAGVNTALSPQAVAAASDLVIIVVGFDQEAEAVIFGERGVLERRARRQRDRDRLDHRAADHAADCRASCRRHRKSRCSTSRSAAAKARRRKASS